ncbi:MAG: hypothetical protein ACREFR_18790, partial [Limisphaerales bacterium]
VLLGTLLISIPSSLVAQSSPPPVNNSTTRSSRAVPWLVHALPKAANAARWGIVEIGPDECVWALTNQSSATGGFRSRTHRIVELATGLNYKDPATGRWMPTRELVTPVPGGALAQFGPHRVFFASDLNNGGGAIDVETSDGRHIISSTLGLSYYDTKSGKSVTIAQVQDCQGKVIGQNQMLYTNAFDGLHANVRFTYTRAGLEQDVILLQQPPPPGVFGLCPTSTVLQAMTKFVSFPAPVVRDFLQMFQAWQGDAYSTQPDITQCAQVLASLENAALIGNTLPDGYQGVEEWELSGCCDLTIEDRYP